MVTKRLLVWLVLGLVAAASAQAGMIDKEGVEPQALCGLCHSLDGVSRMSKFPKLAGQKAAYIKKQFLDFHAGRRANDGGQMSGITREIDTAQIDGVAQYFAELPRAACGGVAGRHGRASASATGRVPVFSRARGAALSICHLVAISLAVETCLPFSYGVRAGGFFLGPRGCF